MLFWVGFLINAVPILLGSIQFSYDKSNIVGSLPMILQLSSLWNSSTQWGIFPPSLICSPGVWVKGNARTQSFQCPLEGGIFRWSGAENSWCQRPVAFPLTLISWISVWPKYPVWCIGGCGICSPSMLVSNGRGWYPRIPWCASFLPSQIIYWHF